MASKLFPGRNSMVMWKGKKIQIQTQMHMDSDPPEIGTVVIKDGQVVKRKSTPVGSLLKQPDGNEKVNLLLQKQHNEIYQAIEQKKNERVSIERRIRQKMEQDKKAQEQAAAPVVEEKEPGGLKRILSGLFGKKKE